MGRNLCMNDLLIKSVLLKGIPKDYPKYKKYEYLDKLQDLDQYMIYDNNQLDTLWINMKLSSSYTANSKLSFKVGINQFILSPSVCVTKSEPNI